MRELSAKVNPYLIVDGINVYLSPDAPEEIKEMDKRLESIFDEEFEKAGNFLCETF